MRRAALALLVVACGGGHVTPADGGRDASASADAASDAPVDAAPDAAGPPAMLALSGAIVPVHDPSIIATAAGYYLFATGQGLRAFHSADLRAWVADGAVFAAKPAWITTTPASDPNNLWAPDISFFGGQYHLYYAASSFGSNASCIGHATSPSLSPATWTDHGAVICSTASDNWNALDPAAHVDGAGQAWLAFGSFWGGLKLIPLAADGSRAGSDFYALATRANTAVEAPYLVSRGGWYYLFESVDYCCQGVNSTYKVMVGRAPAITGPYVDAQGTALLAGGGTLVVQGDARWKGPGHDAVLETATGDFHVYHSYDAQNGGAPTLRIGELRWSADGWPLAAGP
ncbi:MAG: arabinan endo-1,5-alpha-L-arabinosidase [Deltaproteobacteria bacterium]|nr:arabinan endo-1,5-alpha-L-arabinosidase [Deltaproteobacteria bacterium]